MSTHRAVPHTAKFKPGEAQLIVLAFMRKLNRTMTQTEISHETGIDRRTVSGMVARLKERGHPLMDLVVDPRFIGARKSDDDDDDEVMGNSLMSPTERSRRLACIVQKALESRIHIERAWATIASAG
jgi:DNA-binding MarR family transcriptional regulator